MHTSPTGLLITRLSKKNMGAEKNRRRSNNYFIFVLKEAEGWHLLDGRKLALEKESIHFVAQGLTQSFEGIKKMNGYCIEFSPDLFSRFTLNKEILYDLPFFGYQVERNSYKIPSHGADFLFTLFEFMYTEFEEAKAGHERVIISGINITLLKCKQWFSLKNRKNDQHYVSGYYGSLQLVEKYRKLIREHFTRQHFVKFYAAKLNQTPNYLNMVVKNVTGAKASDLIHEQIIGEAKHLLIHTKLSHKEVAAELGFSDPSYFTKFFKRETGQKPLDWFRSNK